MVKRHDHALADLELAVARSYLDDLSPGLMMSPISMSGMTSL
jgi:hypothetical protein